MTARSSHGRTGRAKWVLAACGVVVGVASVLVEAFAVAPPAVSWGIRVAGGFFVVLAVVPWPQYGGASDSEDEAP